MRLSRGPGPVPHRCCIGASGQTSMLLLVLSCCSFFSLFRAQIIVSTFQELKAVLSGPDNVFALTEHLTVTEPLVVTGRKSFTGRCTKVYANHAAVYNGTSEVLAQPGPPSCYLDFKGNSRGLEVRGNGTVVLLEHLVIGRTFISGTAEASNDTTATAGSTPAASPSRRLAAHIPSRRRLRQAAGGGNGNQTDAATPDPAVSASGTDLVSPLNETPSTTADARGGAGVIVYGGARLYLEDVHFVNGKAPNGAGIAVLDTGSALRMTGGACTLNKASHAGGCIFLDRGGSAELIDVSLCSNQALWGPAVVAGEFTSIKMSAKCCQSNPRCLEDDAVLLAPSTSGAAAVPSVWVDPLPASNTSSELIRNISTAPAALWSDAEDADVLQPQVLPRAVPPSAARAVAPAEPAAAEKSLWAKHQAAFIPLVIIGAISLVALAYFTYKIKKLPRGSRTEYTTDMGEMPTIPPEALISRSASAMSAVTSDSHVGLNSVGLHSEESNAFTPANGKDGATEAPSGGVVAAVEVAPNDVALRSNSMFSDDGNSVSSIGSRSANGSTESASERRAERAARRAAQGKPSASSPSSSSKKLSKSSSRKTSAPKKPTNWGVDDHLNSESQYAAPPAAPPSEGAVAAAPMPLGRVSKSRKSRKSKPAPQAEGTKGKSPPEEVIGDAALPGRERRDGPWGSADGIDGLTLDSYSQSASSLIDTPVAEDKVDPFVTPDSHGVYATPEAPGPESPHGSPPPATPPARLPPGLTPLTGYDDPLSEAAGSPLQRGAVFPSSPPDAASPSAALREFPGLLTPDSHLTPDEPSRSSSGRLVGPSGMLTPNQPHSGNSSGHGTPRPAGGSSGELARVSPAGAVVPERGNSAPGSPPTARVGSPRPQLATEPLARGMPPFLAPPTEAGASGSGIPEEGGEGASELLDEEGGSRMGPTGSPEGGTPGSATAEGDAGEKKKKKWSRRGLLDKSRQKPGGAAVSKGDEKGASSSKAGDAVAGDGDVHHFDDDVPAAAGNPFANRTGGVGASAMRPSRGRLQASSWSLAADHKTSKRSRKLAQQKGMLNRSETSAQLFAISEGAEIRYTKCGLLYEVPANEAAGPASQAENSLSDDLERPARPKDIDEEEEADVLEEEEEEQYQSRV